MPKKLVLILVTVAILTAAIATMAPNIPRANCSPGFWKNHTGDWRGYDPGAPFYGSGMTLLEALQGGKDTRESRFIVAGWLNFEYYLADSPCEE